MNTKNNLIILFTVLLLYNCIISDIQQKYSIPNYSVLLTRQLLKLGGSSRDIFVVTNEGYDDFLIYSFFKELSQPKPDFVAYTVMTWSTFKDRKLIKKFVFNVPVIVMFMDTSLQDIRHTTNLLDPEVLDQVVYVVIVLNTFDRLSIDFTVKRLQQSFLKDINVVIIYKECVRSDFPVLALRYQKGMDTLENITMDDASNVILGRYGPLHERVEDVKIEIVTKGTSAVQIFEPPLMKKQLVNIIRISQESPDKELQ